MKFLWYFKNKLGSAVCHSDEPPSKAYIKYIEESEYKKLLEQNNELLMENQIYLDEINKLREKRIDVKIGDLEKLRREWAFNVQTQPLPSWTAAFDYAYKLGQENK